MKEATGELNMTVIVVLAVAALAAFFYTILWPLLSDNLHHNANCAKAICVCEGDCKNGGMANCWEKGKEGDTFPCPWKG